ncbi:MAG: hypothetical protein IJ493_04595 [Clostridia bacterium]|nr:hypothetical protein [Clostridia bacterium]
MTNAASQKMNNPGAMSGQRISTHPSYTEYTWDSLSKRDTGSRRGTTSQQNTAPYPNPNARPQAMRQAQSGMAQPRTARPQTARPYQMSGAAVGAQPRPVGAGVRRPVGQAQQQADAARARAEARRRYEAQQLARTRAEAKAKTAAKRRAKVKTKSITHLHTIMAEKRYSFPLSIVLLALAFTVLIMSIVTTSAEINEITSKNSSLQREYASLVSNENELRLQLETRDDLRAVETMATNELGMVKKDEVERYYLTIRREDKIELVEEQVQEDSSLFDGILEFGSSLVSRVRAFFGL